MNSRETRMKGDHRRELILEAATIVFGDHGYVGTTTAVVAAAAGVSQPYVVRMFGTKQQLFIEVLQRALDILMTAFRTALAAGGEPRPHHRLGLAFIELAGQRGLLLSLMHGFVLGKDPVIGGVARDGFMSVYEFLRTEAGFSPQEAQQFLSVGMLINTLVGLRMVDDYDSSPDVRELMNAALPEKLDVLLALRESTA